MTPAASAPLADYYLAKTECGTPYVIIVKALGQPLEHPLAVFDDNKEDPLSQWPAAFRTAISALREMSSEKVVRPAWPSKAPEEKEIPLPEGLAKRSVVYDANKPNPLNLL